MEGTLGPVSPDFRGTRSGLRPA